MGSKHEDSSQSRLNEHFSWFSGQVEDRLRDTIRGLRGRISSRPIQVLDIGHGAVPYARAFDAFLDCIELTFLDCDKTLQVRLPGRRLIMDFFDVYDVEAGVFCSPLPSQAATLVDKRFDLIVLSAALHELYFDAVSRRGVAPGFHGDLLGFLRGLLSPDGSLLIADYAWPPMARAEETWEIAKLQKEILKHADPPWAFIQVREFQSIAARSGLKQMSTFARGLYDDDSDDVLNNKFDNRLTTSLAETVRLRLGFVLTFSQRLTGPGQEVSVSLPRLASLVASKHAADVLGRPQSLANKSNLRDAINHVFMDPREELGGHSALWHLWMFIAESVNRQFRVHWHPEVGTYETWFGVGLETLHDRYVPMLTCGAPDSDPRNAGLLSPIGTASRGGDQLLPGPLVDAYEQLTSHPGAPTIHGWAVRLHERLRENGAGNHRDTTRDQPKLSSITFVFPYRFDRGEYHYVQMPLASSWAPTMSGQRASGHYLRVLKPATDDQPLSHQISDFLFQVSVELGCDVHLFDADERTTEYPTAQRELWYEAFLHSVFSIPSEGEADRQWPDWFERLWQRVSLGKARPRYRAYTTIIEGCDGLSSSPPDTIMIFGEKPFPPPLLDEIDAATSGLFRRLGAVEAESKRAGKAEEKEREERLAIVAGTSHTFKNLLTPLRAGLSEIVEEDTARHGIGSPIAKAVRAYQDAQSKNYSPSNIKRVLREANAPYGPDLLESLLDRAARLSDYGNVVERLWAKIYGLHISSLSPGQVDVARWCVLTHVSRLVAGSFFCSWYAFLRDDLYQKLRDTKKINAAQPRAVMQVSYVMDDTVAVDKTFTFGAVSAANLESNVISSFRQIRELSDDRGPWSLPALVIETLTEETLFNAIKYGDLNRHITVALKLSSNPSPTLSLKVSNAVDTSLPSLPANQGRRFLRLLAGSCGAAFSESPPGAPIFYTAIDSLPLTKLESK